jgi:hypothetical protein
MATARNFKYSPSPRLQGVTLSRDGMTLNY